MALTRQQQKAMFAKKQKELRSQIKHNKKQLEMSKSFFRLKRLKRLQGGLRK